MLFFTGKLRRLAINSTIAIRSQGQLVLGLQENFSIHGKSGKYTLLKEHDLILGEPKVFMLLEKILCGASCWARGHDVPGNDNLNTLGCKRLGELHS